MSLCPSVRRTFSDERGTGAFHSLGALPRRSREKSPVFHIPHDDDDSHSSSLDEHAPPPAVRFPTSRSASPPSSESSYSSTLRPTSPRPPLPRGASAPILLSNGKPLKSSLKSSSSSPAIVIPPHAQHMHFRARSEPNTPKNVHFPEEDYGLATVRVFKCSARPAALSNPANGNGDDTETEGEDTPPIRFPFSTFSFALDHEIDPTKSSRVPSKSSSAYLVLESLNFSRSSASSTSPTTKPLLTGSILVRNLAFEKHVAIRFTLDDWQTISEVGAHHVDSLSTLPSSIPSSSSSTPGDTSSQRGRGWDRFTFIIHLEDYSHSLSTRTLWLAARYRTNSTYPEPGSSQYGPGGEWWDNNGGRNYRISFRAAIASRTPSQTRPRRETISAPISSWRSQLQPPMNCKEHVLGLVVPSVPDDKQDRRLTPLRAGKLSLCNYAPPTSRVTPSISSPCAESLQASSPLLNANPTLSPSSDEDSSSPASSTLSTPSVSPTIVPRVIIGGQPATSLCSSSDKEDGDTIVASRPRHIVDWDWSAHGQPRIEGSPRQRSDFVPVSEPPERQGHNPSSPGRKAFSDNNALYDAFVTQWCFAQGPSSSHHPYDSGGIMT